MCDFLRREGINDMRGLQEFCISRFQEISTHAQARGVQGPGNQGIGALGRDLDAATVSWIAEQAREETGTNWNSIEGPFGRQNSTGFGHA